MHAAELSADLTFETHAYPLPPAVQAELVALLRTEWTRTDYDWIEAMHGDYGAALVIASALVRCRGAAVATATVHFASDRPEVAVLGGVVTHPAHRRRGLAGQAIERALALAEDAGCRVCLLGTTMRPRNVYHEHGFAWHNGAVMRRAPGNDTFEQTYFAADQSVEIRKADWGDLPGLSLLLAQPLALGCLDYLRGLMSGNVSPLERCLSNFPVLWYATSAQDGAFSMLAEPVTGRIFGFGTVTRAPGPARRHTATVDLAVHENYSAHMEALLAHLLDGCRKLGVQQAHAFVADGDRVKLDCLREQGFRDTARLPAALRLSGGFCDAVMLGKSL